jgi:hypothetical protein
LIIIKCGILKEWNGQGFGYEITYRPKAGGEWKTVEVNDPFSDKVTIEFSEPQPFKPYEVRVKSKNNVGPSLVEPATVDGWTGEVITCFVR